MISNFVEVTFIITSIYIFFIVPLNNILNKKRNNKEQEKEKQLLNKKFNFIPIFDEIYYNTDNLLIRYRDFSKDSDYSNYYFINLKNISHDYNIYDNNIHMEADDNYFTIYSEVLKNNYFDNKNLLFNNDNMNNILELEALFKVLLKEINAFNQNNHNAIYYYVNNEKDLLNNNQIKIIEGIMQQFDKLVNKLIKLLASAKINSNDTIEHNNNQVLLTIKKTNEIIDKLDKEIN